MGGFGIALVWLSGFVIGVSVAWMNPLTSPPRMDSALETSVKAWGERQSRLMADCTKDHPEYVCEAMLNGRH